MKARSHKQIQIDLQKEVRLLKEGYSRNYVAKELGLSQMQLQRDICKVYTGTLPSRKDVPNPELMTCQRCGQRLTDVNWKNRKLYRSGRHHKWLYVCDKCQKSYWREKARITRGKLNEAIIQAVGKVCVFQSTECSKRICYHEINGHSHEHTNPFARKRRILQNPDQWRPLCTVHHQAVHGVMLLLGLSWQEILDWVNKNGEKIAIRNT